MADTATYDKIATQTLASAASSITFSSIAASWTDLRLVVVTKASTNTQLSLLINGDTTATYSYTQIDGQGTGAYSHSYTAQSSINTMPYNGSLSTTIPAYIAYDLFSYAGSTYKTGLWDVNTDFNGGSGSSVNRGVTLWRSTAAVTSLTVTVTPATMSIGATATLYGILKA